MIEHLKLSSVNSTLLRLISQLMSIDLSDKIDLLLQLRDELVRINPECTVKDLITDPTVSQMIRDYQHKVSSEVARDPLDVPVREFLDSKCKCPECGSVDYLRYFVPKLNELERKEK